MTALVVDDSPGVLDVVSRCLRAAGVEAHAARSASEALEVSGREGGLLGLILLDVEMPGGDGPGLLPRLLAENRHALAYFMTAGVMSRTEGELPALGAGGVFGKPFRAAEPAATLASVLRGDGATAYGRVVT